jgi:pyrroloquinoline quinone biosynthesis protein D
MSGAGLREDLPAVLPPWVRMRFDKVRDRWVLLAPERVLFPCATSVEILERLPEAPTLGALIDALAAEYEAPREAIATDVRAMLGDLAAQGFLSQPEAPGV